MPRVSSWFIRSSLQKKYYFIFAFAYTNSCMYLHARIPCDSCVLFRLIKLPRCVNSNLVIEIAIQLHQKKDEALNLNRKYYLAEVSIDADFLHRRVPIHVLQNGHEPQVLSGNNVVKIGYATKHTNETFYIENCLPPFPPRGSARPRTATRSPP